MFFIAPFDPHASGTYAIQDVFTQEIMRPDHAQFALFEGELEDSDEHCLLLVAPALNSLTATAIMAKWQPAPALPSAKWILLVGPADAWDRFGVPYPHR